MNLVKMLKSVNYKGLLEVLIWLALNWEMVSDVYDRAKVLVRLAGEKYSDKESRVIWFDAQIKEYLYEMGIKLKSIDFWLNLMRELAWGTQKHAEQSSTVAVEFEESSRVKK